MGRSPDTREQRHSPVRYFGILDGSSQRLRSNDVIGLREDALILERVADDPKDLSVQRCPVGNRNMLTNRDQIEYINCLVVASCYRGAV